MPQHIRPETDQRTDSRSIIDQPMAFSLFNTRQRLLEHSCRICNHSETGMCFTSGQPLYPGMVLCIMKDPPSTQAGRTKTARETALAEVRWCRPDEGREGTLYEIGVRFY